MNLDMLKRLVTLNEGKRNAMYKDSLGIEVDVQIKKIGGE